MVVILPFKVTTSAQFQVQIESQGAKSAHFLHVVVAAVRDMTI